MYNPMWRFLGDHTTGPPGTYFYRKAVPNCLFWHTFDQALIRPALIPHFGDQGVRIVTEIEGPPLLTPDGVPNRKTWSDHLPVLLRLNI